MCPLAFRDNDMDRIMSTAQPEDCHRAVLVRKPNPAIATNTFKFYLSNKKRSGGSKVSNIIRDEENNCLIVFYDSRDGLFFLFCVHAFIHI